MTSRLSFILLGMLVFTGCVSDYRAGPFADWIDREAVDDVAGMVDDHDHIHKRHGEDDALLISAEPMDVAGV